MTFDHSRLGEENKIYSPKQNNLIICPPTPLLFYKDDWTDIIG